MSLRKRTSADNFSSIFLTGFLRFRRNSYMLGYLGIQNGFREAVGQVPFSWYTWSCFNHESKPGPSGVTCCWSIAQFQSINDDIFSVRFCRYHCHYSGGFFIGANEFFGMDGICTPLDHIKLHRWSLQVSCQANHFDRLNYSNRKLF